MTQDKNRILVRSGSLARCSWCGTPESYDWVTSVSGKIYCSNECLSADESVREQRRGYVLLSVGLLVCVPLLSAMILYPPFWALSPILLYGLVFVIAGLDSIGAAAEGKKYLDRKDKYKDVAPIECQYCAHLNPPNATRCLQCDASLSGASISSDTTPPRIHQVTRQKGVKCPHCSAVYSYAVDQQSGRWIVCQNCAKRFIAPSASPETKTRDSRLEFE